ncbi:YceI family protein [Solirubrobacter sp. CPCC 204708]|uniref:YceI family protein n=1 Tax=Solirubrobacter deserti TaxID=2282478 RepID=A0ABT4RD78_9ACTN|nr:YceI family protein [Solirubrobacter deserti]MBE2317726.1 YceI family protein [Solirubrobacter deserti]MDA0136497.1 YceI family protein [Solirubrobacter deserti]
MSTAPTLARTFAGDRDHSSFGFAVKHMSINTFRGTFADVEATVTQHDDGALVVVGSAAVESISVTSPADLRTHLLGPDFFDAVQHPRIAFASAPAQPAVDGTIALPGELTIRNVTRPITATGTWSGVVEDPFGATRAALALRAVIDRRDYGMTWNLPLPRGGDALGTDVEIVVALELVAS